MPDVKTAAVYGDISGNRAIDYTCASVIDIYSAALVIGRISDNDTIDDGCRAGIPQVNPTALAGLAAGAGGIVNNNAIGDGRSAVGNVNCAALIPNPSIGNCKTGYQSVF
jgi:hypothetical protein